MAAAVGAKEVYEIYDRMLTDHYGVPVEKLLDDLYLQEKAKRRWSLADTRFVVEFCWYWSIWCS